MAGDVLPDDVAMTRAPSGAEVARWLRGDFGLYADSVEPVRGGTDTAARVWRVTTASSDFAAKWSTRRARTGDLLLDSLAAEGVETMAPAVLSKGGSSRLHRGGGRLAVSEWFGSRDAAYSGLDLGQWEAYGRLLATLHEHRFALPRDSMRGLRRGIRRRRHRYVAGIRGLDAAKPVDDAGAAVLAAWWAARTRVAILMAGAALRPATEAVSVPCHGDPHLGNVRVSTDGELRLIDWDDAVVAPREVDLHLVEFPVLFTEVSSDQRAAFRCGYGDAVIDEVRLVRFACVRALEDLVASASRAFAADRERDRAEGVRVFEGILSASGSASLVEPRLLPLLGRREESARRP